MLRRSVFTQAIALSAFLMWPSEAEGQDRQARMRATQPDSVTVRMVETMDGSRYHGRIVAVSDSAITLHTVFGTLEIPYRAIRDIQAVYQPGARPGSARPSGEYWFPNPNATRLIFAPTGRMLRAGEGYFSDYMLFFPGVALGVSDQFTFGGGMSVFPTTEQLFYFTPKVGLFQSDKFNLAAGALVIKVPDEPELVGITYGVGTVGRPDASATLGFGWGFSGADFSNEPVLVVGGEARMSRRTSLITENWLLPDADPLLSLGIRFMGEKMAIDFAFLRPLDANDVGFGIPWVDFVVNF